MMITARVHLSCSSHPGWGTIIALMILPIEGTIVTARIPSCRRLIEPPDPLKWGRQSNSDGKVPPEDQLWLRPCPGSTVWNFTGRRNIPEHTEPIRTAPSFPARLTYLSRWTWQYSKGYSELCGGYDDVMHVQGMFHRPERLNVTGTVQVIGEYGEGWPKIGDVAFSFPYDRFTLRSRHWPMRTNLGSVIAVPKWRRTQMGRSLLECGRFIVCSLLQAVRVPEPCLVLKYCSWIERNTLGKLILRWISRISVRPCQYVRLISINMRPWGCQFSHPTAALPHSPQKHQTQATNSYPKRRYPFRS